jgi:hypothetical protein
MKKQQQVLHLTVDEFEEQFRPEINMNINGKRPIENVDTMLINMPFTPSEIDRENNFLASADAADVIVQSKFSVDITNAKLKCSIFISTY